MEPSVVFAGFILCMCAMHLIWQTSEHVAKWWAESRPERKSTKKAVRSDWYVFFSYSDLIGKEPEKKREQSRFQPGPPKRTQRRPAARI